MKRRNFNTLLAGIAVAALAPGRAFAGGMKISIKTLEGKTLALDVSPEDTVESVKAKIKDKQGTAVGEQRLIFSGKVLADAQTLASYSIAADATLHLVVRRKGG